MTIHQFYLQLSQVERELVDDAFDEIFCAARKKGIPLKNADPAERAVEALAKLVVESRPAPAVKEPEPEPLPPLPRYSEPTKEQEDAAFWKYVGNIAP